MSVVRFDQIPDQARLWIYGLERDLDTTKTQILGQEMDGFLDQWAAHKRELTTAWQLKSNRFIMVAVDESQMAASGCSIDSMVHNLRDLESRLQVEILSTNGKVFYRDESDSTQCVDRLVFKELVGAGTVDFETIVYDNTIQTVGDLRGGKWELPMKSSWHMDAFGSVSV